MTSKLEYWENKVNLGGKVKVKVFRYKPGLALGVPGG
jgi:hypothetical protein